MHYFYGISTGDLSRDLLERQALVNRFANENPRKEAMPANAPVFVEIKGIKTQVFGIHWDDDLKAMVLTAY